MKLRMQIVRLYEQQQQQLPTTTSNNNNNRNVKWKLATTRKNIREIKTKLRFTWLFQLQWGLFAQVYLGLVYSLLSLATSSGGERGVKGRVGRERGRERVEGKGKK